MRSLSQLQVQHQGKNVSSVPPVRLCLEIVRLMMTGILWVLLSYPAHADTDTTEDTKSEWATFSTIETITETELIFAEIAPSPQHDPNRDEWNTRVTPVSELSDVLPTDWAYEAVRELSDRYNVPLGFPDGTYRGHTDLTRYEFAAAMIPVLDSIIQVILEQDANWASNADLGLVRRLQEDLVNILAGEGTQVETLEYQAQQLEQQSFSMTTLLEGEVMVAVAEQWGSDRTENTPFHHRLWLDWVTHIADQNTLHTLHTRLMASDGDPLGTTQDMDTAEGTLIHQSRGPTERDVVLDWLGYEIALGDRSTPYLHLTINAKGGTHSHYLDTVSPWGNGFDGNGSLSVFSQASPIYTIGGGTGIGGEWTLDRKERVALAAGYLAEEAVSSTGGVFDQDYAVLAQITLRPTSDIAVGATYVHGYHTPGNGIFDAGLEEAIAGTGVANVTHSQLETPATTDSYGLQAMVDLNETLALFGFGGYTDVQFIDHSQGNIWFYGAGLSLKNWLIPQTSGGIMLGAEPYLTGLNSSTINPSDDTPLHLEAFYSLRFSDQVSVTPGLIWLMAPNQNRTNRDRFLVTLRTTLSF